MESYEKFITNPEQLEEAFRTIREQKMPKKFNQDFLSSLGFSEPNSILYVRLFKNLGLVNEDEDPHTNHYSRFIESEEQARRFIAKQIKNTTYKKVFEEENNPQNLSGKEIRSLFHNLMGPKKSDTIVHLAADTFQALVQYADWNPESYTNQTSSVQESSSSTNGSMEKVSSPHEEFIMELMNGSSNHEYTYENGATKEETLEEQRFQPNGTDKMPNNEKKAYVNELNSAKRRQNHLQVQSRKDNNSYDKKENEQIIIFVQALQRKAELLERLDRVIDAVQAYDNIISYADENKYPIKSENVLSAYFKKATLLDNMENYEEALISYDHLIQRFAKSA